MAKRIHVETTINGVLLGGLYGLFGVGLALVFGVTRIVNIMHGELIALSAFIGLGVATLAPDLHPLMLILPVADALPIMISRILRPRLLRDR